jgi:hypothetical protein
MKLTLAAQGLDRAVDIGGGERDVLDALAVIGLGYSAICDLSSALVDRDADLAVGLVIAFDLSPVSLPSMSK